ncbi:hypothetical protein [Mycolicibacterium porcinum]|uniref:Uncharacterized protein n=1 Tax=Mycolicibacterium porcinum TaxID=39693 RepID=A0ABV3VNQ9_9MYCO
MTAHDPLPADTIEIRPDTMAIAARTDHDGTPLIGLAVVDPQLGSFVIALGEKTAVEAAGILIAAVARRNGINPEGAQHD